MKIRIKKLTDDAVMPKKAHPTDAGFDLYATSRKIDADGNLVYGTGLAFEIPEGYAGFIFPRSSNAKKDILLTNSVGVLDSHYRGEVTMKFKPSSAIVPEPRGYEDAYIVISNMQLRHYDIGDRIGQLVVMPVPEVELEFADELTETDRGTGGYGSTGR